MPPDEVCNSPVALWYFILGVNSVEPVKSPYPAGPPV